MNFLRKFKGWIVAGFLLFIAFLAKGDPRKWQEKAVSNEEDDIKEDLGDAEKASQQAKVHDEKAKDIKKKAKNPRKKKSTSEVLKDWKK